jgi:hypothetical protein
MTRPFRGPQRREAPTFLHLSLRDKAAALTRRVTSRRVGRGNAGAPSGPVTIQSGASFRVPQVYGMSSSASGTVYLSDRKGGRRSRLFFRPAPPGHPAAPAEQLSFRPMSGLGARAVVELLPRLDQPAESPSLYDGVG